ncbi:hypothetical protein [Rhodococcus sp. 11-3]|uniref:hypothetical protein n=1 Tax=Rhodococcus sp. 11-3 TaxID=2854796 RepID=UPI00203CDA61|nr:hypothetical protein [Rhodococcus sp. 11-3]USC17060.1 hypothetical protein KZJ41_09410 [Rhodococcus sp. 11-3]
MTDQLVIGGGMGPFVGALFIDRYDDALVGRVMLGLITPWGMRVARLPELVVEIQPDRHPAHH